MLARAPPGCGAGPRAAGARSRARPTPGRRRDRQGPMPTTPGTCQHVVGLEADDVLTRRGGPCSEVDRDGNRRLGNQVDRRIVEVDLTGRGVDAGADAHLLLDLLLDLVGEVGVVA